MTVLVFDTDAMDLTARMILDAAAEYEVLSSQIVANANLAAMPPEVSAQIELEIGSVSQALRDSALTLGSDARFLAWRSETAQIANEPSLPALADSLFGVGTTVGLSALGSGTSGLDAIGPDPLALPTGCAYSIAGYSAAYAATGRSEDPQTQDPGFYQSSYVDDGGGAVVVPLDQGWSATPDDGSTVVVTLDDPIGGPGGVNSVVVPLYGVGDVSGPSITVPIITPDYSSFANASAGVSSAWVDPGVLHGMMKYWPDDSLIWNNLL